MEGRPFGDACEPVQNASHAVGVHAHIALKTRIIAPDRAMSSRVGRKNGAVVAGCVGLAAVSSLQHRRRRPACKGLCLYESEQGSEGLMLLKQCMY